MNTLIKQYKEKFFSEHKKSDFIKDIFGGVIVALVSIPISMGYAQIAGLPMQYGLYGSVFPILFFGLLPSTHDFVFGVDAAPAALTGAVIASMGVAAESEEAVKIVPVISFFVACWLLLFYLIKAGKAVQYISEPVMGGFVSGICCSIILIQIPKLFGGTAGSGEGPELVKHIIGQFSEFNPAAFLLGMVTIVIILMSRKLIPKVPMSVIMMVAGALLTVVLRVDSFGVKLLPEVQSGFPGFRMLTAIPDISEFADMAFYSLSIAVVIMAESLLASKANALKDGYKLNSNREILSYSVSNFASALTGCCPVNGSVSRTGIVRQFGSKSQWLSIFACLSMLLVLYFGTFIIAYLPVPVLTAIVITALMGACEFDIAARLWKTSRNEFYIFLAAFLGVLIFGTVYGVVIGVVLSFVAVIIRAVVPPRSFMGIIEGKNGFYNLGRHSQAKPIKNVIIYRFGGNLFFGNIDTFQNDIENAVKDDTKYIIVHAGAIGSIDITASDRLMIMYRNFRKRGIRFYITEHVGELNDQLRKYGETELIKNGAVRMTTVLALRDSGIRRPYIPEENDVKSPSVKKTDSKKFLLRRKSEKKERTYYETSVLKGAKSIQAELEWAFGSDAESIKKKILDDIFNTIKDFDSMSENEFKSAELTNRWGRMNMFDEDEFLDRLEIRLTEYPERYENIEGVIEKRRAFIEQNMYELDPDFLIRLKTQRDLTDRELKKTDTRAYEYIQKRRKQHIEYLKKSNPELAEKYEDLYRQKV